MLQSCYSGVFGCSLYLDLLLKNMAVLNILPLLSFRNGLDETKGNICTLDGLSSIRLPLGNWRSGTNDSSLIVDAGWERERK